MDKLMCLVAFIAFSMVLLHGISAQTVHVVGDNMGWRVQSGDAYTTWASGKTFMVGDILEFNFATNEHDVVQVPKASFDECTSTGALGNTYTTGPANITLTSAGEHYYICTFGRHCEAGQKLSITVSGADGAQSPMPGGPSASPTPPGVSTPDSSSTTAFASLLVVLLSIATSLLV